MAMGTDSNGDGYQVYFLKIAGTKQGEKTHIARQKGNGKGTPTTEMANIGDVSGKIESITLKQNEYKGETYNELVIILSDDDAKERYFLKSNMNSVGRSLMNKLIKLPYPNAHITVKVWTGGDGYPALSVKVDGKELPQAYKWDDVKDKVTENQVKKNGKTSIIKDYFELEKFFWKKLQESLKNLDPISTPHEDDVELQTNGSGELPF